MKALYIGYSKTGTKTMQIVFECLGYTSYDYDDNAYYLAEEWHQILEKGGTAEDFKRIFKGVDATVDNPGYHFWEQILEAFPDIKLLVNYRDEESWLKSLKHQVEEVQSNNMFKIPSILSPTAQRFVSLARHVCHVLWGGDRNAWPWQMCTKVNFTLMLNRYRQHNLYIQQKAPKDQLHVVNFKDGWEPICKFLGEPVPNVPFPHVNVGGEVMREYMKTSPSFEAMKREMMISLSLIIIFIGCFIGYILL